MQLIGQPIKHGTFGKGIVTEWNDTTITICFSVGEKKFIYPDAFSEFLYLKNAAMQREVQELLNKREAAKEAERQAFQKLRERNQLLQNLKISPQSQAVFDIKPDQYEELFSTWSVSTGCYVSGYSKGKPRVPERLKPNSMCLLTGCAAGRPEKERRIIGAFMVKEDFLGSHCRDGVIRAHPVYRLQLRTEDQIPFWPYVVQEPEKQRWGGIALKYMTNKTGERILFDIKEQLHCDESQECAENFYQYYCKRNRLQPKQKEECLLAGDC
nr:hypothetical protein [uncultured Oscillibacter sp.]